MYLLSFMLWYNDLSFSLYCNEYLKNFLSLAVVNMVSTPTRLPQLTSCTFRLICMLSVIICIVKSAQFSYMALSVVVSDWYQACGFWCE